jgi:hypothetical protein
MQKNKKVASILMPKKKKENLQEKKSKDEEGLERVTFCGTISTVVVVWLFDQLKQFKFERVCFLLYIRFRVKQHRISESFGVFGCCTDGLCHQRVADVL